MTAIDLTLGIYFVLLAAGLTWWFDDWRWLPGTLLCAMFAWILDRWVFK